MSTIKVHFRPTRFLDVHRFDYQEYETDTGAPKILLNICKFAREHRAFMQNHKLTHVSLSYYVTNNGITSEESTRSHVNFLTPKEIVDDPSGGNNVLWAACEAAEAGGKVVVIVMPAIKIKMGRLTEYFSYEDKRELWNKLVNLSDANGHQGLVVTPIPMGGGGGGAGGKGGEGTGDGGQGGEGKGAGGGAAEGKGQEGEGKRAGGELEEAPAKYQRPT